MKSRFLGLLFIALLAGVQCAPKDEITNVFVIFLENNSFDHIFATFPGANNILSPSAQRMINDFPQKMSDGTNYTTIPRDSKSFYPADHPNEPFNMSSIWNTSVVWPSLSINHRFFLEQYQINNGAMDKFVNFSGAGANGLSYSYFDLSNDIFGEIAKSGTLLDNNFHSAFGGSFLNHQWLICGCTPVFPNETIPDANRGKITVFDPNTGRVKGDAAEGYTIWYDSTDDKFYGVNTLQSINPPVAASPIQPRVPSQNGTTIGDLLSARGVSWKWYSGGYNDAMAGNASPFFQFHHQPFTYFTKYAAADSPDRLAHLKDEVDMFADLAAGKASIPKVGFYKPRGDMNFHPATSGNWILAQTNLKKAVDAILASEVGNTSLIIITFDENGGYWDHVAPPVIDKWGPGTRVPTILLGNYVRKGHIDSTQYETLSVTRFIEEWAGVSGTVVPAGRATNSMDKLLVFPPPSFPDSAPSSAVSVAFNLGNLMLLACSIAAAIAVALL